MSIRDAKKSRGRPATGQGTPVTVRLQADQLAALDAWISRNPSGSSRPEAIRKILKDAIG